MEPRRDLQVADSRNGRSVIVVDSRPDASIGQAICQMLAQATPPVFSKFVKGSHPMQRAAEGVCKLKSKGLTTEPSLLVIVWDKQFDPLPSEWTSTALDGFGFWPRLVVCRQDEAKARMDLLQEGFSDFVLWPCTTVELLARIRRQLDSSSNRRSPGSACAHRAPGPGAHQLLGTCDSIKAVVHQIRAAARSSASVLITGETGTGKEVCAREIHFRSLRHQDPFVPVNCGALPDELFESELFGHERGAYTGAAQPRQGLIAATRRGTLFLDEVDALSLRAQCKLLRFLQDGEIRRVGADCQVRADVRIVAATNADLRREISLKKFRKDLWYRLAVLGIQMPPLRDRGRDILLLAEHFIRKHAAVYEREAPALSSEACQRLCGYRWPGNVRELSHVLERAVLVVPAGVIEPEYLMLAEESTAINPVDFNRRKARLVADFEMSYLKELMARHAGNITQAAKEAGKNRRALYQLLHKHNLLPRRSGR